MAQAHRHGAGGGLVDYLGGLVLAGGDHDGQPFAVLPWERRFVRGAFAVSGPAALSVARGNGKSALVAGIASAVVDPDGPLHGPRREAVAVASSFDQSRVIFEDVLSFLRAKHDLGDRKLWRVQDSANRATVEWRATGARVRCIGSDPAKAHGLRPALALLDEPAQWDATKQDRMVAAIRTGLGKVPGSRLIALGTRPADAGHWFAKLLKGGAAYAQSHAARPDDPPFRLSTWRRANPSFDHARISRWWVRISARLLRYAETMVPRIAIVAVTTGQTVGSMTEILPSVGVRGPRFTAAQGLADVRQRRPDICQHARTPLVELPRGFGRD